MARSTDSAKSGGGSRRKAVQKHRPSHTGRTAAAGAYRVPNRGLAAGTAAVLDAVRVAAPVPLPVPTRFNVLLEPADAAAADEAVGLATPPGAAAALVVVDAAGIGCTVTAASVACRLPGFTALDRTAAARLTPETAVALAATSMRAREDDPAAAPAAVPAPRAEALAEALADAYGFNGGGPAARSSIDRSQSWPLP